jgi:hypothetical protein
MADLHDAKDTIRALPRGIQLATTKEVAAELERRQRTAAVQAITEAYMQILTETPDMTIDDANQLIEWQEEREEKWGSAAGPPTA